MLIVVGVASIVVLTAATGFFVAQEFAYVAVDRGRLRVLAEGGDPAAGRALRVTPRLSFMLSGAQVGITVTALLAGYVAEPFLGRGLAELLGATGLSQAGSVSVPLAVALLFATVVQMVFSELAPKNLAIAKPETLARAPHRSAWSPATAVRLSVWSRWKTCWRKSSASSTTKPTRSSTPPAAPGVPARPAATERPARRSTLASTTPCSSPRSS
jgi:CBS domain containing-hemolysin-like protein